MYPSCSLRMWLWAKRVAKSLTVIFKKYTSHKHYLWKQLDCAFGQLQWAPPQKRSARSTMASTRLPRKSKPASNLAASLSLPVSTFRQLTWNRIEHRTDFILKSWNNGQFSIDVFYGVRLKELLQNQNILEWICALVKQLSKSATINLWSSDHPLMWCLAPHYFPVINITDSPS